MHFRKYFLREGWSGFPPAFLGMPRRRDPQRPIGIGSRGRSHDEKTLTLHDLYTADEVFITSTNRTLLGVSEISGHRYSVAMGPI